MEVLAFIVFVACVSLSSACTCNSTEPVTGLKHSFCQYDVVFLGWVISDRNEPTDDSWFALDCNLCTRVYTVHVERPIYMPLELMGNKTLDLFAKNHANTCGITIAYGPVIYFGKIHTVSKWPYKMITVCNEGLSEYQFHLTTGSDLLTLAHLCGERPIHHLTTG